MKAEQFRDLGFQLEGRAPGGESGGAWFAIAADGARVVLKWFADESVADRYARRSGWPAGRRTLEGLAGCQA